MKHVTEQPALCLGVQVLGAWGFFSYLLLRFPLFHRKFPRCILKSLISGSSSVSNPKSVLLIGFPKPLAAKDF